MIGKVLIANRGEIVVRVIRTCRKLGLRTVAVYSEADRNFSYVREADEAYLIGPANPIKSYLSMEAIMDAVRKSGADAVHPGYGFLSENSRFAEAVLAEGRTWIGPPVSVLKAIDSKCLCRKTAVAAGVPVVPGTVETLAGPQDVLDCARKYGFPLVLKLDKGGGGKGIELVREEAEVREAYERLSRIGLMAFGHPESYVEKEILRPRHIEVQFLADDFGNCVCLGERECTIQRRYQKIIEESLSSVVSPEDRRTLFEHTGGLVREMGYRGAGTMEFLRAEDGNYFFMEINARLQVEHPVTEMLTGLDLVEEQIRIASGEKLLIRQSGVAFEGHAIEARIYAEDPLTFAPSPGAVQKLRMPETGKSLRIDHALEEGCPVPPYYDPLLAKVIAWSEDRKGAIEVLKKALCAFTIEGIKTTIPTNLLVLGSADFEKGDFHTGFIDRLFSGPDGSTRPSWPCM